MRDTTQSETERGQAYTLEGFVSAMIVLMAVLFALQSVVITPTTGGLADRTTQAQLEQETQDALVIAANDTTESEKMSLSEMVRYWDDDEGEFYDSDSDPVNGAYNTTSDSAFYQRTVLGQILRERFTERGLSYNVELVYQNESAGYESDHLVYQGESAAVTASYTVTLYDSDNLTAPHNQNRELSDAAVNHPIPEADSADDSKLYNVVEVRVSVW